MIEVASTQPPPLEDRVTALPSVFGPEPNSAGAMLRNAREVLGVHVPSLAGALKVPQRQIEALEEDRFDLLPDIVYARALAATICRHLRVDPAPVLERLPRGPESRLGRDLSINVPFRSGAGARIRSVPSALRRPSVIAAIALVLGALLLASLPFLPGWHDAASNDAPAPGDANVESVTPAAPGVVTETGPAGGGVSGGVQQFAPAGGSAPLQAMTTLPAADAAENAATANSTTATPATASTTATPEAAAMGSLIEFRASQPSWVQVTDARGVVPLRRTLAAGEAVSVDGTPPLAVTVGSVEGMQVQVRGRAFDLAPLAQGKVARFEVR